MTKNDMSFLRINKVTKISDRFPFPFSIVQFTCKVNKELNFFKIVVRMSRMRTFPHYL